MKPLSRFGIQAGNPADLDDRLPAGPELNLSQGAPLHQANVPQVVQRAVLVVPLKVSTDRDRTAAPSQGLHGINPRVVFIRRCSAFDI